MKLVGKTQTQVDQEQTEREAERNREDAKRELERIDRESIRALRAKAFGKAGKKDDERLAELEQQASKQREVIRSNT